MKQRAKIEIQKCLMVDSNTYWIEVDVPVGNDPEDTPEVVITHDPKYLNIQIAVQYEPIIVRKPETSLTRKHFDESEFAVYDWLDFLVSAQIMTPDERDQVIEAEP